MMLLDNDEKIMNAAFILLLPLISVIPKILNPLILLIISLLVSAGVITMIISDRHSNRLSLDLLRGGDLLLP